MFFFDPLYFLLAIPPLLLGMWAQFQVSRAFNKYSQVFTSRGLTGAQVAREMLDREGLTHVVVERVAGRLSDHYDPRSKTLRLSPDVHDSPSVAAAGIAAHEAGHAIQDQLSYAPLKLRSALVPVTSFGSQMGVWLFFGGWMLMMFMGSGLGYTIALLGLMLFATTAVFAIVTLPVEFDATKRAKTLLVRQGFLAGNEMEGVNKVLDAAALTYVAAALQAVMQVLYYATILFRGRD
jgi:uncharacterized protein